jgi:probable phosphoglycerate mutase
MTDILLVRHGRNDWVKKNRLAGWIPGVHLDEEGHKQAADAAQRLAHLPIKAVYSSPVTRCLETADYIARQHAMLVQEVAALGEVRYGQWEGKKIKKLAKKPEWYAVQHFPSRFRFPEGESLREVQQRAITALETLAAQHDKEMIVAVSHADVIKLVLAHYLGIHIDLFQRIGLSPASVSQISLSSRGMVRVLRVNDDGPIQPPPKEDKAQNKEEQPETAGQPPAGEHDGRETKE